MHCLGTAAATVWDVHTREQSVPSFYLSACPTQHPVQVWAPRKHTSHHCICLHRKEHIYTSKWCCLTYILQFTLNTVNNIRWANNLRNKIMFIYARAFKLLFLVCLIQWKCASLLKANELKATRVITVDFSYCALYLHK